MIIVNYPSKKILKESIGQPLDYKESSMFWPEYKSTGKFVATNRPGITGIKGREFFAEIEMKDDKILKVS